MVFANFPARQKSGRNKAVVHDYFAKHAGQALCLSDDRPFVALLESTVKALGLSLPEPLILIAEATNTLKVIAESFAEKKQAHPVKEYFTS